MAQKVLVLGATPYTEVFIDMFRALPDVNFVACVTNDKREDTALNLAGLSVLWHEDIHHMTSSHLLICMLGTTRRRNWIEQMAQAQFDFTTLVHPSSVVSARTPLSPGVSIDAGCVIAGYSKIFDHVRIGRNVSVGHHTEIGPYATLHPGSIVSGNCRIGTQTTIGTGSVIIDGLTIGDGAFVAAGAVVTKDIPPRAMVAGNPAQIKRVDYGPI